MQCQLYRMSIEYMGVKNHNNFSINCTLLESKLIAYNTMNACHAKLYTERTTDNIMLVGIFQVRISDTAEYHNLIQKRASTDSTLFQFYM